METFRPNGRSGVRMRVHARHTCDPAFTCIIHSPTNHHMRSWHLHWRSDRGIFERICPHSIGHPDPDQREFWKLRGRTGEGVHGCDGCCAPPV